jgi:type IV secretory pathway TrbL component
MESLNLAFFFVTDMIIDLQAFFITKAWAIAKTALLIALSTAAVNYAISGEGLKNSVVKIAKAFVFFALIMNIYPRLVGAITQWTFSTARDSVYTQIEQYLTRAKETTAEQVAEAKTGENPGYITSWSAMGTYTYGSTVMKSDKVSEDKNPMLYFSKILQEREHGEMTYTVVAPAAVLEIVLLVAGECFNSSEKAKKGMATDFGQLFTGLVCGFAVIATGIFAVLEYVITFLEFMLVSGVGIILFPLSLWEGSKFMSEKFVGALTGFFIKLLFSNLCIFFMLYGFMTLAKTYTLNPFSGQPGDIAVVLFVSLLFFYICKSAPGLAQSLLTGTPSLSATGAISAMAGAAAGAAGAAKLAGKAAAPMAGGLAKTAFGAAGALQQAGAASKAAKALGGDKKDQAGAFMSSLGGSAKEAARAGAGDLARSLIGGKNKGAGGGFGAGAGVNRHSQTQRFLGEKNADGTKKTFRQQAESRRAAGTNAGLDYMANKEAKQNKKQEAVPDKTA